MATKRKSDGKPRRPSPKRPSDERLAEILTFEATETVEKTAAKFGMSERSIWRWKAMVGRGELPEVAALVRQIKSSAVQRCKDLLTEAYEASLRRMIALLPDSTIEQAIKAGEMCGGLKITKDALGGEPDSPTESSGDSPEAPEASRRGQSGEATPIH
jgi:hypothetical protein